MNDSFIFYGSFFDAIELLPPNEQAEAYRAIALYALKGEEELPKSNGAKMVFIMAKPNLDANNKRRIDGTKGGRPKGTADKKTTGFQNEKPLVFEKTQNKKPNVDVNVDDNVNVNENVDKKKNICAFFEQIWTLYPNKKGKASVSDKQKEKLFAIGYDEMKRAIDRYCQENAKTDLQYWKHGSTFFNSGYVDYLDDNYQPRESVQTKSKADNFTATTRDLSWLVE